MKKLLLASIIGLASTTSFASGSTTPVISSSDSEIKLEGFYLFESGFSNQNRLGEFENLSDNRKKTAFYTEAAFAATITKTINDVIGGVKIVLQPTTRSKTSTSYNGSHIFIETSYGKIELGSPYDAGNKLRITGGQVAAGSGGYWRYINVGSQYMQYNKLNPDFDTSPSFYIESFSNNFDEFNVKAEAARKISFYTPKMKGFQAGISYTPDSVNTGGNKNINNVAFDNSVTGLTTVKTGIKRYNVENSQVITINQNVTDSVSGGLTYEHALGEDADLKLSVTGEYGKPARVAVRSEGIGKKYTVLKTYKLSNLKAYNLGAVFTYGNFSCGASYGSLGKKSLTTPEYHKNGRNTYYYNGAIAYGQGPIKTSLSYFKSSRYKNTVDTITVATEYKIMPGLLPYAEISHFQAKGKPVYYPEAPNKKTKGTVGLIGTKLKF